MKTFQFLSCKISSRIDLKKVAAFFKLPVPESWEDCIVIGGKQLAEVYKYRLPGKKVYLFSFGCVTFENFDPDKTGSFLKHLRSITGDMDYAMYARYYESHTIKEVKGHTAALFEDNSKEYLFTDCLAGIIAVVLARSVALSKVEADVAILLDEAENLITELQRGALHTGTRKFASTLAHILRFEHESTAGIRLFDRPVPACRGLAMRGAYDELAAYYELEDRYNILEKKIGELRDITRSYSRLRYWRQENRLLLFEIFLLALFPLSYFVHDLLRKIGIEHVIKFLSLF